MPSYHQHIAMMFIAIGRLFLMLILIPLKQVGKCLNFKKSWDKLPHRIAYVFFPVNLIVLFDY